MGGDTSEIGGIGYLSPRCRTVIAIGFIHVSTTYSNWISDQNPTTVRLDLGAN